MKYNNFTDIYLIL